MTRRKNIRITEKIDCRTVPKRKTGPGIKKFRKTMLAAQKRKEKAFIEAERAAQQASYERQLAAEAGEWDFSKDAIEEMIAQGAEELARKIRFTPTGMRAPASVMSSIHPSEREAAIREKKYGSQVSAPLRYDLMPPGPEREAYKRELERQVQLADEALGYSEPVIRWKSHSALATPLSQIEPEPPEQVIHATPPSLGKAIEEFMAPVPTRSSEKRRRSRMKGIPDSGGFTENAPLWDMQEQAKYQSPFTKPIYDEVLRHSDTRHYVEQALYNKTGVIIDWNEGLSCGSFGCAFETDDPEKVVKITGDPNEAPGAMAILASKRWWPGLIGVHNVFKWPGKKKIWFLVMERVANRKDDVSFVQSPNTISRLNMKEDSLSFGHLVDYDWRFDDDIRSRLQRAAVQLVFHGNYMTGWPRNYNQFWEQWMERFLTEFVPRWPQFDDMGATYSEFWERYRIVFPDIHIQNLGCRIYEDPESGLGPTCTTWLVRGLNDEDRKDVVIQGPQLLCLDLGVSGGDGVAKMRKKRPPYLNPMLAGYMDYIPEL